MSAERPRTRHPLWGAIFGLLLGLGALLLVLVYGWAAFSTWYPMAGIIVLGIIFGILVGLFAPARRSLFW